MWKNLNIIREEKPKYSTILLRKPKKVKVIETIVFLSLIVILSQTITGAHPYFKAASILSAVVTLGLTPIIYSLLVKPKYILTDTTLIIQKNNKEQRIPIASIESLYEVRYFFLIDNKKTPLTVSNEFIDALEDQIEELKRKK